MKSIRVIQKDGGVKSYTSGSKFICNEDGTHTKVQETDEEMEQTCYNSLIEDIRQQEFHKAIVSALTNYMGDRMTDYKNVNIKVTGKWTTEYNIQNPDRMFEDMFPMDIPDNN